MGMNFSIAMQGFYSDEFRAAYDNAGTWPNDCMPVSEAEEALIRALLGSDNLVGLVNGSYVSAGSSLTYEDLVINERGWRDSELRRADIELSKLADGVSIIGTEAQWRQYRCELRDWPENEEFPNFTCRPAAPDAEGV